jgi:hypothetical protein
MILFAIFIYIAVLVLIGFLSGLLRADTEEWILFATLWPLIIGWLVLQAIALIGYCIGEKLKNGDHK